MSKLMILPIGAGVIGQDDVPLVRIMDSDETPTTITVYGVVDTVQPVTAVTWTVNGVEQTGEVSRSPVLELTDLQPETSYAITLRATNINGESSASARTITTKKITTVTPDAVLDGVSYYNLDVYYTGNIPTKDENDIVVDGRNVTVPTGYYAESETVSVSSEYIIPTGTKNITDNGNEDVTQYANVNVNVQPALYTPSNVTPTTSQQTISTPTGYYGLDSVTVDGVTSAIDANIQAGNIKDGVTILGVTGTFDPTPNLDTLNVTPSTSSQTLSPTGGIDGWDEVNVGPVGASIDQNITAGNIKKNVTILGVTGTYDPQPNMTAINVVPTKQSQVITPTGGVDGFDEVNVYPVTSLIDSNITPENIKKDVAILGVTGTFEGGIQPTGTLNIVNNGTYDITNYASVNVNVAAGDFNFLCFTANEANCSVGMSHNGTNATTTKPVMYYSTDGRQTWTSWDGTTITLANQNDKVYFYGQNLDGFSFGSGNYSKFITNGNLSVSGNIMTLITMYGDREYIPSSYCFYRLFQSTTINDASNLLLPPTTLTNFCYEEMFYSCPNLVNPPELPATTLAARCYRSMFSGCSNLISTPELPATNLYDSCYYEMFKNCTSLTTIRDIKAKQFVRYACYCMFQGCSSITIAPELYIDEVVEHSINSMFSGCTSLNRVTVLTDSWYSGYADNWLYNVSQTGTFYKPANNTDIPLNSAAGVPTGWTVADMPYMTENSDVITFTIPTGWSVYYTTDGTVPTTSSNLYTQPIDCSIIGVKFYFNYIVTDGNVTFNNSYYYSSAFYIEALENNTVLNTSGIKPNYSWDPVKVEYSTNKKIWSDVNNGMSTYTLTNTGDRVYFRKKNVSGDTWAVGGITTNSGTIKVGGSFEYAVYHDITGDRPNGGAGNMFQNCTGLVDASKLVLFGSYYYNMFSGCTNLVYAPSILPATTVTNSGYNSMFKNCTSLTTVPELPATNLDMYCYKEMFKGCTSLVNAQSILPATILNEACYLSMFEGCTSLAKAPELPATTRSYQCYYQMFKGCTSLVVGPKIMLNSIYVSASGNGSVVYEMFSGCTSLERVEIAATSWDTTSAEKWLNGVATNGVVIVPTSNTEIPSNSTSGIPTGWCRVGPKTTPNAYDVKMTRNSVWVVLQNEWPNDNISYNLGEAKASDGEDFVGDDYIEVNVKNGQLDYDDDWDNSQNPHGQFYPLLSHTFANGTGLYLEFEMEGGYNIDFDRYFNDCSNWETLEYSDFEDCNCQENNLDCAIYCEDCDDWEECGYESYEDCDCQVNGNCPEEE